MKWLIASDLHGSAYYCRKLLEAYDLEKADRMLLLGDILYHGPRNDLPCGISRFTLMGRNTAQRSWPGNRHSFQRISLPRRKR